MTEHDVIKKWAFESEIRFVNGSSGQHTHRCVSMEDLVELALIAARVLNERPLKLVGYVPAGDKDFTPPEIREAQAATNLSRMSNAAQATYWMEECQLEVRPVYIGPALSNPPKQGQAQ